MKKKGSENKVQHHNQIGNKRQSKGSSPGKGQQQHKNMLVADNLINFDINSYPFMNQEQRTAKIYRSTVNLKLNNLQLQKLMRLNHFNLINIQKITRGHGKEANNTHEQEVYYSFYYEEVPYSLKYVAMHQDNSNNILKKINKINLPRILNNVSDYLLRLGITYIFNLGDIGVKSDGQIKVYVSPVHFSEQKEKLDKSHISLSIEKIVAWWETTIASNTTLNPKSSNIILPSQIGLEDEASIDCIGKDNQISFIDREASQLMGEEEEYRYSNAKESMVKNIPLKTSNNSLESDLSKISSNQINKMKKIDQQIKYIRERLKDKRRKHKESDSFHDKKEKYRTNMIESQRFQKKDLKQDKEGSNVIEKIQQNINCINIYTHPKQNNIHNNSQQKIKRMTTQPIYSYKIAPENVKQKAKNATPVIVHHPSFEPQDFPNSESASSIDTYEMQLQTEIEPAKAVQRHSALIAQRQISEKNYRPSHNSQNLIDKKPQNQVANKHVTESAGPLQFKNFVNKYIKPQFLAKKSNIYQDPMEYESQTSKSISKKKKKIIADLYETGKSANSHTQKSSSLNRSPQEVNCKKKESYLIGNSNLKDSSHQQNTITYSRTNSEIKLIPIRDNSAEKHQLEHLIKNKKTSQESKIGQRIKLVLEKTKNAIALLNRVKNCRSPPGLDQKIHNTQKFY